jgi:hypothetical protein
MQSTSDSGRLLAASNLALASQNNDLPRRRLVVEVYSPPQRVPNEPRTVRREPRGETSRALAVVAVIGLHASFGGWLWMSSNAHRLHPPLESLVLLEPLPAPVATHTDLVADLPAPDLLPMPLTLPKLPMLAHEPNEIAVSVSATTDVLIGDANAREVEEVLRGCSGAKTRPALPPDRSADITLLVRVEKDGRVSDSKIEVGSGTQRVDQAAQRCLLAHGVLTPRRVSGAPVASWQRVHWPAVSTSARISTRA